ncbi:hypothetical protein B0H15DRAFT_926458 [Mycena belliarum]|uniref:Uncharacterized protein n=1 Tax=Mycena belliarum TaxID=1033014 RepID=A0AAD6UJX9_9AGAR|nr:hypothetical protein B0H15DRAFT_926458 [Mycena belliae]
MHIPYALFFAVLFSVPTFAAPVPNAQAGDEFSLEARAAKKAKAAKPKAVVKPKPVAKKPAAKKPVAAAKKPATAAAAKKPATAAAAKKPAAAAAKKPAAAAKKPATAAAAKKPATAAAKKPATAAKKPATAAKSAAAKKPAASAAKKPATAAKSAAAKKPAASAAKKPATAAKSAAAKKPAASAAKKPATAAKSAAAKKPAASAAKKPATKSAAAKKPVASAKKPATKSAAAKAPAKSAAKPAASACPVGTKPAAAGAKGAAKPAAAPKKAGAATKAVKKAKRAFATLVTKARIARRTRFGLVQPRLTTGNEFIGWHGTNEETAALWESSGEIVRPTTKEGQTKGKSGLDAELGAGLYISDALSVAESAAAINAKANNLKGKVCAIFAKSSVNWREARAKVQIPEVLRGNAAVKETERQSYITNVRGKVGRVPAVLLGPLATGKNQMMLVESLNPNFEAQCFDVVGLDSAGGQAFEDAGNKVLYTSAALITSWGITKEDVTLAKATVAAIEKKNCV